MAATLLTGAGNVTTAATTVQPVSLAKPSNLADADLLLEFMADKNSGFTHTYPAGMTSIAFYTAAAPTRTISAAQKYVATASGEPSTYPITATSGTSRYAAALVRCTGAHATTPIDTVSAYGLQTSGTSVDAPTITPAVRGTTLVLMCLNNVASLVVPTFTGPSGMTLVTQVNAQDATSTTTLLVYQQALGTGAPAATGVRTVASSAAGSLMSFMFTLTPAVAVVPPTAAFTTDTTGHTVAVDASTSTAGGGSITGYAWNFGDGGTATGVTATHRYTTAGTYTVTLTVTQTDATTGQTTHSVTPVDGILDAKPAGVTQGGAFFIPTSGSGNSGLLAVLADSSKTSFGANDGTASPTGQVVKGWFGPMVSPGPGMPIICPADFDGIGGTTRSFTAKFFDYDGTTFVGNGYLVDGTGALTATTTIPVALYTDVSDGGPPGTGSNTAGTVNRTVLYGMRPVDVAALGPSGLDKLWFELTFSATP